MVKSSRSPSLSSLFSLLTGSGDGGGTDAGAASSITASPALTGGVSRPAPPVAPPPRVRAAARAAAARRAGRGGGEGGGGGVGAVGRVCWLGGGEVWWGVKAGGCACEVAAPLAGVVGVKGRGGRAWRCGEGAEGVPTPPGGWVGRRREWGAEKGGGGVGAGAVPLENDAERAARGGTPLQRGPGCEREGHSSSPPRRARAKGAGRYLLVSGGAKTSGGGGGGACAPTTTHALSLSLLRVHARLPGFCPPPHSPSSGS